MEEKWLYLMFRDTLSVMDGKIQWLEFVSKLCGGRRKVGRGYQSNKIRHVIRCFLDWVIYNMHFHLIIFSDFMYIDIPKIKV